MGNKDSRRIPGSDELKKLAESINVEDRLDDREDYSEWSERISKERDQEMNKLLIGYSNYKTKSYQHASLFQSFFFWFMLGLLTLLTAGLIVGFIIIPMKEDGGTVITALISIVATYVSSLFAILNVIAKYLFPEEGTKQDVEFLDCLLKNKK